MANSRAVGFRSVLLGGEGLVGAAILAVFLYLALTQSILNDGDTSWHLATGKLILATRAIPHVDPFSFTFAGHAWTAHEWLAEVLMALAFGAGAWAGLTALFAAVIAITLTLLARQLLRWLPLRYVLLGLAGIAAVLAPFMLARPHVLTWPILVLWVSALIRARERHRAPPLAWAGLMIVWANLHASYLMGLAIAAAFALEALLQERDRRRVIIEWGAFGLLSAALAFVTPHGIQGFLYPLQVSGMKTLPLIQEWRSSRLPDDLLFFILLAAAAVAAILRGRELGLVRLVLLAGLALMAVLHSRHQPLFVLVSALVLPPTERRAESGGKALIWLVPVIAAAALIRSAFPETRADSGTYPARALAAIPPELRTQPVFNSYSFGGPLILNGIRPYIDGRADMYGDAFTADHNAMVLGDGAAFERAVQRFGVHWTMLQPGSPLIPVLDHDPRWKRVYADRWAVIHVRT
ncbi:hypothetical protein LZ016_01325 [Sphingomonas sp. SM33]|uniref:Glycosyltransferase RgtA/B/C/D-like domain-containing protein n=1 Tax=Sphingomonas telluris TaxID=2907998 RepID=A0ABS9VJS8_9SPHN|nr:hypothetical protein [Sphingomonas telluris]MCH8614749.1 hypothetical protein [Sphingomonas telluris]